ncbi:YybH family protein [Paludisphaera rhizosphaerae]|uniref:YybH family protein n=1 Tax=Paludisphaera rhizosphaerae TaxID=2711216 RepID=UPI001981A6A9|nr:SgcJ/EcaC family oxidoreductase [Paludisphaera rhizosphaerae]
MSPSARLLAVPFVCLATSAMAARAESPPAASAVEAEIRAVDAAFVRDYDAGDAKALATRFTEDAEVFEADGARYSGRPLIERSFADTFADQKGAKLNLEIASIRPLTPEVVKEEGRSITRLASGETVPRFYTVLYVKRGGSWLIASVREENDELVSPRERLKELEWMLGEWLDSGPESETRVTCRWSPDGNFLLREFTEKHAGKVVLSVTQRVGWDPVAKEFRSWEFDSEGGFGEGRWSRDGDRWVIKQSGVRPEGATASSTRILVRLRPDRVRWSLVDHVVDGRTIPGEVESILTRTPPTPLSGVGPAPSPAPTAPVGNDERRPR